MSSLVWDKARRRYRYSTTGTALPVVRVWATVERAVAPSRLALAQLTRAALAGGLSADEWRAGMQRHLRRIHTAAVAVACGGLAQMTPAHKRYAAAVAGQQDALLTRLAAVMAADDRPDDSALLAYSALLADSARGTYENTRIALEARAGATEERRLRHAADTAPTCLAEEARGWLPIGTGRLIGDGESLTGCRCRKETR